MKSKLKNLLIAGSLITLLYSNCDERKIPYFSKEERDVSLERYHEDEEYKRRCLEFKDYIASDNFMKNIEKLYPKNDSLVIPSSAEYVRPGEIGYNEGPLYSYSFHHCSAIILDYGKSAFLAHAYPQCWMGDEKILCYEDIVDELIKKSKEKNLNPKKAFAIVHTTDEEYLRRIIYDLKINKIPIKTVHTLPQKLIDQRFNLECWSENIERNVLYFPKKDSLCISWSNICENVKKHKKIDNNLLFLTEKNK